MMKKDYEIDLVISSSAIRAKQTADIIANTLDYPLGETQYIEDLYHAGVFELEQLIRELPSSKLTVLIVCHEPTVSGAAQNLLARGAKTKTDLRFGLSTASAALLKSELPWKKWVPGCIEKGKIIDIV